MADPKMNRAGEQTTKVKKTSYRAFLNEIFDGSFMTKDALRRNLKLMLLIVACIFVYISNHYAVIMKLSEIDTLQKELTDIKYEALTVSSQLMRESRQSYIREMVKERGLELEDSTKPPYTISKE
ncbi:MAG: FtsL-like putative cell division protein [Bacteroidales bacterium]|nr:FtsL-like putative cell division protein [Bacteroidales bacterium]